MLHGLGSKPGTVVQDDVRRLSRALERAPYPLEALGVMQIDNTYKKKQAWKSANLEVGLRVICLL